MDPSWANGRGALHPNKDLGPLAHLHQGLSSSAHQTASRALACPPSARPSFPPGQPLCGLSSAIDPLLSPSGRPPQLLLPPGPRSHRNSPLCRQSRFSKAPCDQAPPLVNILQGSPSRRKPPHLSLQAADPSSLSHPSAPQAWALGPPPNNTLTSASARGSGGPPLFRAAFSLVPPPENLPRPPRLKWQPRADMTPSWVKRRVT